MEMTRVTHEQNCVIVNYMIDGVIGSKSVPFGEISGHINRIERDLRQGTSETPAIDEAFMRFYEKKLEPWQRTQDPELKRLNPEELRQEGILQDLRAEALRRIRNQKYDSQNDTSGNNKPYSTGL